MPSTHYLKQNTWHTVVENVFSSFNVDISVGQKSNCNSLNNSLNFPQTDVALAIAPWVQPPPALIVSSK